jgi:hypothetical protein
MYVAYETWRHGEKTGGVELDARTIKDADHKARTMAGPGVHLVRTYPPVIHRRHGDGSENKTDAELDPVAAG